MLLIYPPVSKPSEPPAGIARLSGALNHYGIKHAVLDASLEGLMYLSQRAVNNQTTYSDTWTRRAFHNFDSNLYALKNRQTYRSMARYRRAVMDVNHVMELSSGNDSIKLNLSNYHHEGLSPTSSRDLLTSAETPELNAFYPYFSNRLSGIVEREQPAIVGFSISYLSQALSAFAMLGFLRRKYPWLKLVCGGGLITSWLRGPGLDNAFSGIVDLFVEGPGEHALLELSGIDGSMELNYTPDYHFLPATGYLSPGMILPYSGSSGCFWNRCSFCPEKSEGNHYLPVGVSKATEDIGKLALKHQPALIHLLDNSVSPALMKSLIERPPGAPWYGFARIDNELTDMDFCMDLRRSGCVMLKIGVESGDQHVLDKMQKGIDLDTASLALKTLKRAGIASYVYLLFGTPEETISSARSTLDFTVRHGSEIGFLNLALFNMPYGCPEALSYKTSCFYEGDLSLYCNFEHPSGWNRKDVRQFIDKEFRRHPVIAEILSNEPPFFTSNHAPFFVFE
jgi:hypothetical protein